jgi:hypothetical protein
MRRLGGSIAVLTLLASLAGCGDAAKATRHASANGPRYSQSSAACGVPLLRAALHNGEIARSDRAYFVSLLKKLERDVPAHRLKCSSRTDRYAVGTVSFRKPTSAAASNASLTPQGVFP